MKVKARKEVSTSDSLSGSKEGDATIEKSQRKKLKVLAKAKLPR